MKYYLDILQISGVLIEHLKKGKSLGIIYFRKKIFKIFVF
ncbi:hypothetical protein CLV31_105125 [Algoriphagus aquaeductus]|uniref:Uncharacterized protein n=1 Tax=Algoriphagus aquaeductus TaxID=475299 RepID=A0A326RQN9_9BACT|nr:hypothetical protein CLV31_105125 [Algoriphagus aquaeductus]